MHIESNTNYVPVASLGISSGVRFKFLSLTAQQVQQFLSATSGGSSRDLLVWMLLLNAARVSRKKAIKFSPRWRFGVDIDRKTIYRCLKRLNSAGLIDVEFRRGKSPLVTIN
jgi:predicted transcriptional regulator